MLRDPSIGFPGTLPARGPLAGLVLALLLLVAADPAGAQKARPPAAAAGATRRTPPIRQATDLSEPDEPGQEAELNRQLWESGGKRMSYEQSLGYVARAQAAARGKRSDVVTLPTGWALAPAGTQTAVGLLPYGVVSFAGRMVVLNGGWYSREPQRLSVVDPATHQVVHSLPIQSLYPSAAVWGDSVLFVSGGYDRRVYRIGARFGIADQYTVPGYASGVALLGDDLAVASMVAPDSAGSSGQGRVSLLDAATGVSRRQVTVGYFPTALAAVDSTLFVAMQGEDRVLVLDRSLSLKRTLVVGRHPSGFCRDGGRLYVVNSGSDDLSIVDLARDTVVGTLPAHFPGASFGSAPTACVAAWGKLFVTEAGVNAVAVYDAGATSPGGYIPTGWYPTALVADSTTLWTVSAKGVSPRRPNPDGPQPVTGFGGPDYVLSLLVGSLGAVPRASIEPGLAEWTRQVTHASPVFTPATGLSLPIRHVFYIVRENRTYDQVMGDLRPGNGDSALTLFGRGITPAAHKLAGEFVTLDNFFADGEISVLGHSFTTSGYASPFLEWLGNANYSGRYRGYPFGTVPAVFSPTYLWDALNARGVSYRIYGEPYYISTAAYRILVELYGPRDPLVRRFYAHSMALADSTDRGRALYGLLGTRPGRGRTTQDALRLLGDSAFRAGFSRVLTGDLSLAGALVTNATLRQRMAAFLAHYAFAYAPWDLKTSDLRRYAAWKADFDAQIAAKAPLQFSYIWLPNDHTAGSDTTYLPPRRFVAQNDAALGLIVEAISHSPIWAQSLILVEEDDAQNGPDHVDATRTVALAIGPNVKRHTVVSDRYDQLSMLRTVELALGLDPLNLQDALAVPMIGALTATPDLTPFTPPPPSAELSPADRQLYEQATHHVP